MKGIVHVYVCHTRWHSKEYKAVPGSGGHYVIQGGMASNIKQCRVVEGIVHVCVCHTRWHSK